jgi:hypothetical protein
VGPVFDHEANHGYDNCNLRVLQLFARVYVRKGCVHFGSLPRLLLSRSPHSNQTPRRCLAAFHSHTQDVQCSVYLARCTLGNPHNRQVQRHGVLDGGLDFSPLFGVFGTGALGNQCHAGSQWHRNRVDGLSNLGEPQSCGDREDGLSNLGESRTNASLRNSLHVDASIFLCRHHTCALLPAYRRTAPIWEVFPRRQALSLAVRSRVHFHTPTLILCELGECRDDRCG